MACFEYFTTVNSKSPKHISLCGKQPEVSEYLQPEVAENQDIYNWKHQKIYNLKYQKIHKPQVPVYLQPEVPVYFQPEVPVYLQPEVVRDVHLCAGIYTRNRFESSRWVGKVEMRDNVVMLRHCSCHIVCPSLPSPCLPHPGARPSSSHQLLLTRTQLPQFVPFRGDLLTPVQCIRTHGLPLPKSFV